MTQDVMSAREWARPVDGAWVQISGAFEHGGFAYAANFLDLARPSDLARIGAKEILPADSPPSGCTILGRDLIDVDGSPKHRFLFEPLSLDVAQQRALQRIAADRYEAALAFTYDGVRTAAAPALGDVTGLIADRRERGVDPLETTRFKLADAEFRNWSEAELVAFRTAIRAHIQPLFDLEEAATASILAAETAIAALAVPDTIQWA